MIRTRLLVAAGALFAAACERADLVGPQATQARLSLSKVGEACTIDIGATVNPLPALHVLETLLGVAAANPGSSVNCGQIRSLDAKMELIAKALDQNPPDFAVACGVSGALVNEMNALVRNGQLQNITFPPPAPGAPTNLLAAAEDLSEHWCAAKRGELVGPR